MLDKTEITQVKRDLEDKDISLADIARECGVHRSLPGLVLYGRGISARVRNKIIERLGRDPWALQEETEHSKAATVRASTG